MFGYVLPVKPELKLRDYENYRATYCGVCKQLGKSYGVFSRFLLNYDMVLVALLADALSGEQGLIKNEGCFANPVAKHPTLHSTKGLTLASNALIMLSWHKLADNLDDEKWAKKLLLRTVKPFLGHMYKKAAKQNPQLSQTIEAEMQNQRKLESENCALPDAACEPTAKMCAAIFSLCAQTETQKRILSRLGLFAGQIVYLLDAAEDYEKDAKTGSYNVYIKANISREDAIEHTKKRCRMAAGEIALCYNLLTLQQYKPILDNIFYLGLPVGITFAGTKRDKRRSGHGQIESV